MSEKFGGMFIPKQQNLENVVLEYLENARIEKKSFGSSGVTYIIDVNDYNIKNPFLSFEANANLGTPVKKLIVKLCAIEYEANNEINLALWKVVEDNLGISLTNKDYFINEINTQTDIFFKSLSYLQPLCPGIAYSGFLEYKNPIQNKIITTLIDDTKINDELKQYLKFGIIVMQLADNYDTVYKLNGNELGELRDKKIKCCCLFILIQLALIGYTHRDHHFHNLLYNPNDHSYFGLEYGRPLLIDFGTTTKIPITEMREIKKLAKKHSYTNILEKLCEHPIADKYILDPGNDKFYRWACSLSNYWINYDDKIRLLFELREMAIDAVTEEMYKLHMYNKNYPLLPLSNSVKNKLYKGLFIHKSILKPTENVFTFAKIPSPVVKSKSKSKSPPRISKKEYLNSYLEGIDKLKKKNITHKNKSISPADPSNLKTYLKTHKTTSKKSSRRSKEQYLNSYLKGINDYKIKNNI
jgi:hypothetical protein